jgi:hypothetical protein
MRVKMRKSVEGQNPKLKITGNNEAKQRLVK